MATQFNNGIHHITVLAGDAQRNVDFYVKTLGMRLVKKSVNQDEPGVYHLFYGNADGSPGSGLTFFPFSMARQGKPGLGEAVTVSLLVPQHSQDFWAEHLAKEGIDFDGPYDRFGYEAMGFRDPDLLHLELVFSDEADELPGWEGSTLSPEHTIRGFWGTTLRLDDHRATAEVLTHVFGFEEAEQAENLYHYTTDAPIGNHVIIEEGEPKPSANGRRTIHNVAFRTKDEEMQKAMRQKVIEMGMQPTQIIDRHWFRSVYFMSPGGVLFEIATDGPGYDVDESADKLGEQLILPPWLESQRDRIEKRLPELSY